MSKNNTKILVATYGTLLTGQGNHGVMLRSEGVSQGGGWTVKDCDIFDYCASGFPAVSLTRNAAKSKVRVEVFELPAEYYHFTPVEGKPVSQGVYTDGTPEAHAEGKCYLGVGTDGLEGYSDHVTKHSFYDRSPVQITLDTGEVVTALIYHIEERGIEDTTLITSGDWVAFQENDWAN